MTTNSDHEVQLKTLFKGERQEAGPIRPFPALIEVGYGGDVDVETIIRHLQPVIETQVKEYLVTWKETYQHPLSQYAAILDQFLGALEQLEPDTVTIGDLWRELTVALDAIYEWSGWLSQEVSVSNLKRAWQKQFLENLQDVPTYADVPIPPDCWTAKPDDSWQQRWRKAKGRTRTNLNQVTLRLKNLIHCLFKISPLDPFPAHRKIQLHSFLSCYVGLPVAEFLMAQWLQFLQQLALQLYELYTRTGAIKAAFLPLDDFETAILKFDPARLNHKLESLQNQLQLIAAQFERLDHFEIEAGQKFETFQADLYQKMRQQWHLAGTYQLLDSSFDQRQVVTGWRRFESQVADAHRQWLDQFRDQQREWQVSLELSLLQLAAAQICQHRLNSLEHRIRQQLIPAFATVRETIILFAEEITALKKANPAALKQSLAEQNRLILEVLQQDKLPRLMDELIAVQLAPAMENETTDSIERALAAFSQEHLIFSHCDLNNPLPKSATEDILTLKKLLLEHLLPELEKGFQAVNAENRQLIEKLIRGLAEMDQVVEVNLKQAVRPLARQQDPETIAEARLAIITELNRTAQQLNELAAQAEQLLAASRQNLVQVTGDFENRLEHLTDTGQISEVYLQLTGKKVGGKIRIYRRKLFLTLKTAIPNLFGLLSSTLQQFHSSYARLREMAGLTPDKAEAQENLSQFLIDTEKHISALPYFYQRLFRLEPLSDEQFFTARARELAVLKTEFERWQNGRFAATAIIGERGSGITTLLNFAEEQFYKDYPVVKIDFLDGTTIFTEEALFDFLKSIFKETDLKSGLKNLDELENKINALEEQKIFIVENLQQLFLRTPYGFDALERFLLFISRTHQKIHWLITCAIYSWEYLAKVINIDEYVQQKIFLNALSPTDLKNIILTRHRVSSYQLLFQPTDKIANSRRFKKLSSELAQQTYLQNLFFKQLTELAAGNITVAILLWLRSYVEFSQDRLIFPATIHFDPTFLYQLTTEELFTLAAVLQHDIINAQHHALIFHQDIQPSLLLLNRMANKGFLVQKSNGYQIHPLLYRPVVSILKSGNIIH